MLGRANRFTSVRCFRRVYTASRNENPVELIKLSTWMSRDQNAGQNHSVRIDNSTFGRVEEFKYLGTTLTNKNSIVEDIKSRLWSGNTCYHSVQNLLSSRLLSKNLKIKI